MTNSLKTLLAATTVSILMAGAATAQDAQQEVPTPDTAVQAETVETLDAPAIEIYTPEAVESEAVVTDDATQKTIKIVEDVEVTTDENKIEASSETPMETDVEEEVTVDAEEAAEPEND